MKRHGCDLEAHPRTDQHNSKHQHHAYILPTERCRDTLQFRRAGRPIKQRHSVEQNTERKGPQQEIFNRGLIRARI